MKDEGKFLFRVFYCGLFLISLLWLVEGFEYLLDTDFHPYGIYPRTLKGSIGILTSPWIHSDSYHLFSNSIPLLILGVSVVFFYRRFAVELLLMMYLITGGLVWLLGREAFHVGASGLIYAMIGFLLFSGIFRREMQSAGIAFAFLFLYGGVLQGMFPAAVEPHVSWESHLLGGITGACLAFYYRKESPVADPTPTDENDDAGYMTYTQDGDYEYFYRKEED